MMAIKIVHDARFAYLASLENIYADMGYSTKLIAAQNLLEVHPKGTTIPKSAEEIIIETWTP